MNYESPVLTNKGLAILTQKDLGNDKGPPLKLTKMAIGTGILPPDQKPEELTDLISRLKDINIINFEITGLGLSEVTGEINNLGITQETPIFEIGVYAEDPETLQDVLYTYTYTRNAPAILYPPLTTVYVGEYTVKTLICRNAQVEVEVVKPENARNISYDNSISGLAARDVQRAIDELVLMHPVDAVFEHNLNGYPGTVAIEFDNGYGVQPYGEGPYGGGSGRQLSVTAEYLDRNSARIAVGGRYGAVQSIVSAGGGEYVIRFVDSTLTLYAVFGGVGAGGSDGLPAAGGVTSYNGRTGDVMSIDADIPATVTRNDALNNAVIDGGEI